MHRCGDAGGLTGAGGPCRVRTEEGERCRHHSSGGRVADLKARFLELYLTGDFTAEQAAEQVGRDRTTIWRWRQSDPAFDAAYPEIDDLDRKRLDRAEEAVFQQIASGSASAALTIWWIVNTARRVRPGRWVSITRDTPDHSTPQETARRIKEALQEIEETDGPDSQVDAP